jgi:hypothetical protein
MINPRFNFRTGIKIGSNFWPKFWALGSYWLTCSIGVTRMTHIHNGAYCKANIRARISGLGRFVQLQGKGCNRPLWSRTSTHGSFRQKTRHTRPDCPQEELDSETIVIVHPQSATYGAVCSLVKRNNE